MADFRYPPDCEELRTEVRAWLATAMDGADAHADPRDLTGLAEPFERELHRQAGERGWLAMDGLRQSVFDFEVARADAPVVDTAMTLAGSVITLFASDEQRRDVLARMHAGEVEVSIAYTEPGAGSDLTAVATTARPDGDDWVLDGVKSLITGPHKADHACVIAVTDPDVAPRKGMTMFLVPMGAPGVSVVRTPTMNGWDLGEIHLDGVRLGPGAVLGEVGNGWRQMALAISAERSGVFLNGFARHALDLLVEHVRGAVRDGRPLAHDPVVVDAVGRLEAAWADAERLSRRALWTATTDGAEPDPAIGSMAKVVASELQQDIARTAVELVGPAALTWGPLFGSDADGAADRGRFAFEVLERVHPTIGAGTSEVQRDAIATLGLGLPRRKG
jgi:alkylation response protein AidB-like acyl-CoA dehydrogenase